MARELTATQILKLREEYFNSPEFKKKVDELRLIQEERVRLMLQPIIDRAMEIFMREFVLPDLCGPMGRKVENGEAK